MNDVQIKKVIPAGISYGFRADQPIPTRICALAECDVEFKLDGYSRMQEYCCEAHRKTARLRRRKLQAARKRKTA